MRVSNKQITTAQILNADYVSPFQQLKDIYMYSITAIITGTPTGTLKLQASSDPETNTTVPLSNAPPVNWVDIADSSFTVTTAGNSMWNVRDAAYNYVRLVYTDVSGGTSTAVMKVIVNCKGI